MTRFQVSERCKKWKKECKERKANGSNGDLETDDDDDKLAAFFAECLRQDDKMDEIKSVLESLSESHDDQLSSTAVSSTIEMSSNSSQ